MTRLFLALWLCLAPSLSHAWWQSVPQQSVGVATYQGPGDVFTSSPYAWYSCARGFSAAYAAPGTNGACDVVDTATGAITCTYHVGTNGFVNPSECNGVGQACETACSVTTAYDQTGNGRHVVQATLASMPGLTFNSTPKGTLPAINCSGVQLLATSATVTQSQPLTGSLVFNRTSGTAAGGAVGSNGTLILAGSNNAANQAKIDSGTVLAATANDNTWHAINTLASGGSSAINVNGSETTGNSGVAGFSANNIRLCRAQLVELIGLIAEAGIWAATSTSTIRGDLNTNQRSAANGYNF